CARGAVRRHTNTNWIRSDWDRCNDREILSRHCGVSCRRRTSDGIGCDHRVEALIVDDGHGDGSLVGYVHLGVIGGSVRGGEQQHGHHDRRRAYHLHSAPCFWACDGYTDAIWASIEALAKPLFDPVRSSLLESHTRTCT